MASIPGRNLASNLNMTLQDDAAAGTDVHQSIRSELGPSTSFADAGACIRQAKLYPCMATYFISTGSHYNLQAPQAPWQKQDRQV